MRTRLVYLSAFRTCGSLSELLAPLKTKILPGFVKGVMLIGTLPGHFAIGRMTVSCCRFLENCCRGCVDEEVQMQQMLCNCLILKKMRLNCLGSRFFDDLISLCFSTGSCGLFEDFGEVLGIPSRGYFNGFAFNKRIAISLWSPSVLSIGRV